VNISVEYLLILLRNVLVAVTVMYASCDSATYCWCECYKESGKVSGYFIVPGHSGMGRGKKNMQGNWRKWNASMLLMH